MPHRKHFCNIYIYDSILLDNYIKLNLNLFMKGCRIACCVWPGAEI